MRTTYVIGLAAVLACSKPDTQNRIVEVRAVSIDGGRPDSVVDASVFDALTDALPADAAPADAAVPRRKAATKRSRRDTCREECERRNRYTDCADENGMGPCPCHCP